jgi:quercetin dioxygenase-like cupin family protein
VALSLTPMWLIDDGRRIRLALVEARRATQGRRGFGLPPVHTSLRVLTVATPTSSRGTRPEPIEVIRGPEAARSTLIFPGVTLSPLVDSDAGADNLFTGMLTVGPGSRYPFYSRPFTESLTLLKGNAAVDAETRRYGLGVLDSATLPQGMPRRIVNLSTTEPAEFHVALAVNSATQTWVNARFEPQEQTLDSRGREQGERIGRNSAGARYELSPRAQFQNLYGSELGSPAICGGIGFFEAGARLPCHRLKFDESVTIIDGAATCIVEGRRHELASGMTAFVPRGLCHYLINLTLEPMTIIWVYAGDSPERVIVDENLCHPEKSERARASTGTGRK